MTGRHPPAPRAAAARAPGAARTPAGPPGRAAARRPRGAALLVVMVAVALVTAAAVELAYQARVSIQIAGNGRDELKAQALARGAVALSRLVLHFQARLDDSTGQASRLAGALGRAGVTGSAASGAVPRLQVWKLVPVDSQLAANLFGGGWSDGGEPAPTGGKGGAGAGRTAGATPGRGGSPAGGNAAGAAGRPEGRGPAPAPEGSFTTAIEDEDRKVNVQFDATATGGLQGARLAAFLALVGDRRWDFLFDREDASGQRTTRTDLAVHLLDWVDDNQVQSAVTGLAERPFEQGFGDENFVYDRGPDRYKAKNARFDSLEELFLVTGVSDAFMAAFGDRLTVYPSMNAGMNINADEPEELLSRAAHMADPPLQALLSDQTFGERLQKAVRELTLGGLLSITPYQFATLLAGLGLTVNGAYLQQTNVDKRGGFTDRSQVFRVRGVATVGSVEKAVEAVVTFDPEQAREQAGQLGRLLHWREE